MADQKIELEIVMDDGSIKKAFGSIRQEAAKTEKETGNLFSGMLGGGAALVVFNQGIELFGKMADGIKKATEEVIKLSLEAEKVRVIQAQFAQLTQQNAIATEAFDEAIQKSIAGLMDDDDALQIANESMIRLGKTAQRLPEIFELSRKASAAGFGDMAANAEALTTAIQTGQTRQLRGLGIIADVTKAQEKFALSIGLTASQLTEAQKSYVNANTILDAASKKFKDTDANVKTFSDSLDRFKVASKDAFERFAIGFDSAFGGAIRGILDTLTESLNGNGAALKAQKINFENIAGSIAMAEAKLVSLNDKLLNAKTDTQFNTYNRQIEETNKLLVELKKRQEELNAPNKGDDLLSKNIGKYAEYSAAVKLNDEQKRQAYEADLARQQQLSAAMGSYQQQEIAARQQSLQYQTDDNLKRQEQALLHEEALRLIVDNGIKARQSIETNFSDAKGFNQAQRDALELEQIQAQNAAVLAEQQKYQNDLSDGWANTVKNIQKTVQNSLANGIGKSIQLLVNNLMSGKDAFAGFGSFILNLMGEIATQVGMMLITTGIGMLSLKFLDPTGAIAAGIGLVAIGAVLSSLGGGGSPATSNSGGGGVANNGNAGMDNTDQFNPASPLSNARVEPNTVVNFTIQGDVMDSELTQNRIVELLNSAIDTKGAVVRGFA